MHNYSCKLKRMLIQSALYILLLTVHYTCCQPLTIHVQSILSAVEMDIALARNSNAVWYAFQGKSQLSKNATERILAPAVHLQHEHARDFPLAEWAVNHWA